MTETLTKRTRQDYTDYEINAGLTAMAICSGHRERAVTLLADQGVEIRASTLGDWCRKSKLALYEKVRQEVAPMLKAQMADMHQELAQSAGDLEREAVGRLKERLEADVVETKDLHGIARTAAIATGIHGEKHLLYSGQPTQIVQRDISDVLRDLAAMGIKPELVEGTATEMPDQASIPA